MTKTFRVFCAAALCLVIVDGCFAADTLFRKVSRNYDAEGNLGRAYRRELEIRMFTHPTWRQRLYCNPYEPDIDETLEIYSKADGSRWLSCRRATPSLSLTIGRRFWRHQQFDWKKELDAARITGREIALPEVVANEIELLWRTMLPGLPKEPVTEEHMLVVHAPAIIAFARENNSVKTGKIAMAAYDTPTYRAFLEIVDELTKACDRGASPTDPVFTRLPDKIRRLSVRLQ